MPTIIIVASGLPTFASAETKMLNLITAAPDHAKGKYRIVRDSVAGCWAVALDPAA